MTEIKNDTSMDAVICFGEKGLEMVFPEELEVFPGQPVEWRIVPPHEVTVKFDADDSPLEWPSKTSSKDALTGVVEVLHDPVPAYTRARGHGLEIPILNECGEHRKVEGGEALLPVQGVHLQGSGDCLLVGIAST